MPALNGVNLALLSIVQLLNHQGELLVRPVMDDIFRSQAPFNQQKLKGATYAVFAIAFVNSPNKGKATFITSPKAAATSLSVAACSIFSLGRSLA